MAVQTKTYIKGVKLLKLQYKSIGNVDLIYSIYAMHKKSSNKTNQNNNLLFIGKN